MIHSLPMPRAALLSAAFLISLGSGASAQKQTPARKSAPANVKGWKPFTSKQGAFSALFPATPKSMARGEGQNKVHAFFHAVPGIAYMVTYSDMRENGFSKRKIQAQNAQQMLQSNREGLIIGSRAKMGSEKRLSWQGFPAREVVYDIPQLSVRSRSLLVYARPFLYQVTTITPRQRASDPSVRAFLDSFQTSTPKS